MRTKTVLIMGVWILGAALFSVYSENVSASPEAAAKPHRIVASDSILAGMVSALLPADRYAVEAILPPGQCPGHYDVKLSDVEKTKKAELIVSFKGMPFMEKARFGGKAHLIVDTGGRNWMVPEAYVQGLDILAGDLTLRFPEDRDEIMRRKEAAVRGVRSSSAGLIRKIKDAGIFGKTLIASDMQKEPLGWMGFQVLGQYGRPEALSARDVVRLVKLGKDRQAAAVVDNLQSGPDAGRSIAESLKAPHVVLTNFPLEKGYLATLQANVDAMIQAMIHK